MQRNFFCCDRDFAATVICHWPPRPPERQLAGQMHYSFMEVAVSAQSVWWREPAAMDLTPTGRGKLTHAGLQKASLTDHVFSFWRNSCHQPFPYVLHLGCWKSHPGGLKNFTRMAGWESQSFWALMPIVLIYEALVPRIWPTYCKTSPSF